MTHSTQNPSRAGRYVRQPAGHRAFLPAPLPPVPPVELDELQGLLSRADRAMGRLDGSIRTVPDPDPLVRMYVRKEAVVSSQIEGIQSSLRDVLAAETRILAPDRRLDAAEALDCVRSMNHGIKRLAQLPVSVRLIREAHAELMRSTRNSRLTPGELRTSQNWIGPPGSTLNEADYVPPPPNEVPQQLSDLEKFVHSDTDLPPLVGIGLVHAQFETIHPFLDGNGRIGRLLVTLLLCERKILCEPVLCLSRYFRQHRQRYYDELQSVRDAGTWERWLGFFLRGIIEASDTAVENTRNLLLLRERHRATIAERFGRAAGNGHRLLEYLYDHPIISVSEARTLTGTTFPAANNLVARMVEAGILNEVTGQARHRRFIYRSYIDLLDDDGPGADA